VKRFALDLSAKSLPLRARIGRKKEKKLFCWGSKKGSNQLKKLKNKEHFLRGGKSGKRLNRSYLLYGSFPRGSIRSEVTREGEEEVASIPGEKKKKNGEVRSRKRRRNCSSRGKEGQPHR